MRVLLRTTAAALVLAALAAPQALGHATVLPETGRAGGELYTLSVPNEIDGARTTRVVLTVPEGFSVGPFLESPGWKRTVERRGSGESSIASVTWSAVGAGSAEGGVFQFGGRSDSPGTFRLAVVQSYSDGTVVEWAGERDAELPAAFVTTKDSLGGGSSWLAAAGVALSVAALGLAGLALAATRRRGAA